MDKRLAAQRLSATLGERITEEDVEYVHESYVRLGDEKVY